MDNAETPTEELLRAAFSGAVRRDDGALLVHQELGQSRLYGGKLRAPQCLGHPSQQRLHHEFVPALRVVDGELVGEKMILIHLGGDWLGGGVDRGDVLGGFFMKMRRRRSRRRRRMLGHPMFGVSGGGGDDGGGGGGCSLTAFALVKDCGLHLSWVGKSASSISRYDDVLVAMKIHCKQAGSNLFCEEKRSGPKRKATTSTKKNHRFLSHT